MLKTSTISCVLAAAFCIVKGQPYDELLEIRVCSNSFSDDGGLDNVFQDDYAFDETSTHPLWVGSTTGAMFYWDDDNNDYRFVIDDPTEGEVIVQLDEEEQQRILFGRLYDNDGCICGDASTGTPVTEGDWRLEGLNQFGTPTFALCASWLPHGTVDSPPEVTPADQWGCNRECGLLEDALEVEYQGFEVFTDENCNTPKRRGDGFWRCSPSGCADGYFPFKIRGETGQARHKCQSCETYFGQRCAFCERFTGCQQCDGTPGFGIIGATRDCEWQYCGELCCEEDLPGIPTPDPTPQPTGCDENGPVGGGSGSTDYDCRTDEKRREDSPVYGADRRYFLPEPITNPVDGCDLNNLAECLGDCNNKVAFKCPGTDDNCIQEPPIDGCNDEQPFDLRGCKICKCSEEDPDPENECGDVEDEYWWFSNAVPCASCAAIYNCATCMNGGDYGGGGCAQCDTNYHAVYDAEIGVYYCEENDGPTPPPAEFTTPAPDDWPGLTCPQPCGGDQRFGENGYCFCGCDCNVCEAEDFTNNCADCEYHAGCAECENNNEDSTQDYFMVNPSYACQNCADTFGTRCSYCNDFMGCAQCEPGYLHTYSNCCHLWYCALAPTNE